MKEKEANLMALKKYLLDLNIDQIEDDEEFCRAEYEAIGDYCSSHTLTEDDVQEIESRGYQRYQFKKKEKNQMYTFLVLDFDGTYDIEPEDSYEVEPSVYLIKEKNQLKAERLARKASEAFNDTEGEDWGTPIGELFEEYMEKESIFFQLIGELRIPFGERQTDYLPDYLPRVVV